MTVNADLSCTLISVQKFDVQYKDGDAWQALAEGKTIGGGFSKKFAPVTAQIVRLNILEARDTPAIAEMQLFKVE